MPNLIDLMWRRYYAIVVHWSLQESFNYTVMFYTLSYHQPWDIFWIFWYRLQYKEATHNVRSIQENMTFILYVEECPHFFCFRKNWLSDTVGGWAGLGGLRHVTKSQLSLVGLSSNVSLRMRTLRQKLIQVQRICTVQ